MADENTQAVEDEDTTPTEDLDQEAEQAPEVEEGEGGEGAEEQPGEGDTDAGDDGDGVVIAIGDEVIAGEPEEEDDKAAPAWVKDVRKRNRELERELAALRAEKANASAPEPEIEVGEEPTLESCGHDEDEYKRQILAWNERVRQAEERKAHAEKQREAAQKEWQSRLSAFAQQREALNAALKKKMPEPDLVDAETAVSSKLTREQMAVIVKGAGQYNGAAIVYALGKSPERLEKLAAIKDLADFAIAVGRLSSEVKVRPQKKPTVKPEEPVKGSAPLSSKPWVKKLDQLEAEAERTGNRTKIIQYKRELRAKGINPDA